MPTGFMNHQPGQPEPTMQLDRVIVVNTQSTANVSFTANSYSYTNTQAASENELPGKLKNVLTWSQNSSDAGSLTGNIIDLSTLFTSTTGGGPPVGGLLGMSGDLKAAKALSDAIKVELDDLKRLPVPTDPNGARRLRPGTPPTDVTRQVKPVLNSYLPAADRLHVSYFQITSHAL